MIFDSPKSGDLFKSTDAKNPDLAPAFPLNLNYPSVLPSPSLCSSPSSGSVVDTGL